MEDADPLSVLCHSLQLSITSSSAPGWVFWQFCFGLTSLVLWFWSVTGWSPSSITGYQTGSLGDPPPFHGTSLCERPQFKTRVQICCFGPVTPPWAARPSLAWAGHILNIYIFFFIESVQRVVATAVYYTGVNVFSIYLLLFVYRCVLFCEPLPVWKRFRFWSGRG